MANIAVFVANGQVKEVVSDKKVHVIIIDRDVEFSDPEDCIQVENHAGQSFEALPSIPQVVINPVYIEKFKDFIDAEFVEYKLPIIVDKLSKLKVSNPKEYARLVKQMFNELS